MTSGISNLESGIPEPQILPYRCTSCGRLPHIYKDSDGWFASHRCRRAGISAARGGAVIFEGPCLSEFDAIEAWNWHFEPEKAA